MLTRRVIPDVGFSGSTADEPAVTMQLRPRNFPGSAYRGDAQDTRNIIESSVDVYTEQVFIRARARQMAFKIASSALGVNWQVGSPRLDMREDGLK